MTKSLAFLVFMGGGGGGPDPMPPSGSAHVTAAVHVPS